MDNSTLLQPETFQDYDVLYQHCVLEWQPPLDAGIKSTEWQLPWPELKSPAYKPVNIAGWSLRRYERLPQLGYFQRRQGVGEVYILTLNGKPWMSNCWDELESQAPQVAMAAGHVVIMGAGMGVALYNLLLKPEVTRVTLVERDPAVVEMLRLVAGLESWPGLDKFNLVVGDALEYQPDGPVDYLYVDIWATMDDPQVLSDMQRIQSRVQARRVCWWGQEVHFLYWLSQQRLPLPATLVYYPRWAGRLQLPLIGQDDPVYLQQVMQVAWSYTYHNFLRDSHLSQKEQYV